MPGSSGENRNPVENPWEPFVFDYSRRGAAKAKLVMSPPALAWQVFKLFRGKRRGYVGGLGVD